MRATGQAVSDKKAFVNKEHQLLLGWSIRRCQKKNHVFSLIEARACTEHFPP